MSWFNASQLSSFAKQALSQAQKSIDRVLDIQEEEPGAWAEAAPYAEPGGHGGAGAVAWAPPRSAGTGPRSSPVALGAVRRLRVAGCGPQPSRNELRGLGLFEARSRGVAGRSRAPPSSGRFRESGLRGPWVTPRAGGLCCAHLRAPGARGWERLQVGVSQVLRELQLLLAPSLRNRVAFCRGGQDLQIWCV